MERRRRETMSKISKKSQMKNSRISIGSSNPLEIVITKMMIVSMKNLMMLKIAKNRLKAKTLAPFDISRLNSRKIVKNSQKGNKTRKGMKA